MTFFVLQIDVLPDSVPLWVVIILALLGGVGTFYAQLKSAIEMLITGKKEIDLKKIETDATSIERLETKVAILRKNNDILAEKVTRLLKLNTSLSTAMIFLIDQYELENPNNKTVIETMRDLIKKSVEDGSE